VYSPSVPTLAQVEYERHVKCLQGYCYGRRSIVSRLYARLRALGGGQNGEQQSGQGHWLSPTLSVPACCLWMEISFSIVLERKTLKKNEVKKDGRVAVSAPIGGTPH
jgi:hypothetical protein